MIQSNPAPPTWMHIDLNSCFASVEQQANPHLRGKPVVIAARDSEKGCIVAASYEAKALGIKTGMRIFEARQLCPHFYIRSPESAKYRDVHIRFMNLLSQFSPTVIPKSIDEAILDLSHLNQHPKQNSFSLHHPERNASSPCHPEGSAATKDPSRTNQNLLQTAHSIKSQMNTHLGQYITASIGLGPNRFLAKVAADLEKPNGLQIITAQNLESTLSKLTLQDLPGIGPANAARLRMWGITNPLTFMKAHPRLLQKQVFGSIHGYYWHLKLHGYDVNEETTGTKSISHQYVLHHRTSDTKELLPILCKMTERVGRRLRKADFTTSHLHLYLRYDDKTKFYKHQRFPTHLSTTQDLYHHFKQLFFQQPQTKIITQIALTLTSLSPSHTNQLSLFHLSDQKYTKLSQATDQLNDRYGEFLVRPALMLGTDSHAPDRIGFGRVKDIQNLYQHTPLPHH